MKGYLPISRAACTLAIASIAAAVGGVVSLTVSVFWMTAVLLPLGIGCVTAGWLLSEWSMERISRDNGMDGER